MRFNAALWIAQGLVAVIFLFAGGAKLVLPFPVGPALVPVVLGVLAALAAKSQSSHTVLQPAS